MGGGGGGGDLTPTSIPSSPSCSSEVLPPEFAEYVAVSPVSDDEESDECSVYDHAEVDARHFGRRLQDHLREAKEFIRRYKPGDCIEGAGGAKAGDYILPEITTLLLVGPRGAGKSTLVNRITRVFDKDDDPSAPDRAQVSGNSKSNGTVFLREYPVPRNSTAICIYDTQSLSCNPQNNFKTLQKWMTKGISHGEIATGRDTNEGNNTKDIKPLGNQFSYLRCKTRKVNFVIFVVDGVSILQAIESNTEDYIDILRQTFMYPCLSIGDDKPVVVVTNGERLSIQQRACVQNKLVDLLGIPVQQIFDIPGSDDYQTDLAILDMLRYCIQHAEQNLPIKLSYLLEVRGRETFEIAAEQLMALDAVIEATIIFLCIVILLLRFSDKLLQS
ncbi:hypothetical protein SETIT_2G418800v2 [Setaria italica]|uniref:Uncharacterized protein n=1 Tax=Setaria italica TaxID=4555 RepID=K3ZU52_SETIT|nr:uncharacterized protein LOC101768621 isoform X1 [Setaria italica]RCV14353.1 hypothetical protein SETIT_2G418800v2 [Setaria italica]